MVSTSHQDSSRYLGYWGAVTLALLVGGTLLNYLIDPLMLHGGNRLFERNYVFNERISKLAYYRDQQAEIDCLILGSSRVTFLDAHALAPLRCANYAFSGALAEEVLAYLEYLQRQGVRPQRVFVGVDRLAPTAQAVDIPDFVRRGEPVGPFWRYYATLDVFLFSLETLLDRTQSPAYYDATMRKYLGHRPRQPGTDHNDAFYLGPENAQIPPAYAHMRAVFPDATWVGFVPPVSQWARLQLNDPRVRGSYARSLAAVGALFDEFYDFTFFTHDCDEFESNDGIHYPASIYDRVAKVLANGDRDYRLDTTVAGYSQPGMTARLVKPGCPSVPTPPR